MSADNSASLPTMSVPAAPLKPTLVSMMLNPLLKIDPSTSLPPDEETLSAKIEFERFVNPLAERRPPPLPSVDVLFATVEWRRVTVLLATRIPPPSPLDVFPLMVTLLRAAEPFEISIPPLVPPDVFP